MTQTLTITRGLPGSGKTTWALARMAKDPKLVRINRDALRLMEGVRYDRKVEDRVTVIEQAGAIAALNAGYNVVVDNTHLKEEHIKTWRQLARSFGIQVAFQINDDFLSVPVETCIEQDLLRENSVGKDVIERMYYTYWEEQPKPLNSGPKLAIICDLDGTLALLPEGMYYPAAFNRDYTEDRVNQDVISIVRSYQTTTWSPWRILVSGRDEGKARQQTEDWLLKHGIDYDYLYMRPAGDRRPDTIVKKELYLNHIQGKYRVLFALEDRPSVVRMWRAECGLTCLQVGPNVEF